MVLIRASRIFRRFFIPLRFPGKNKKALQIAGLVMAGNQFFQACRRPGVSAISGFLPPGSACIQFLFRVREGLRVFWDILVGMGGCGDEPVNDMSFGDDGIEPQSGRRCGSSPGYPSPWRLLLPPLHIHRGNDRVGIADIEAALLQSVLQFRRVLPEAGFELRPSTQQFQSLQVSQYQGHGQAFWRRSGCGYCSG